MNFSQFLEMKYLEWQQRQGGRRTLTEFAAYLGVTQNTLSSYLIGRRTPNSELTQQIASKLGLEVFDVLQVPRPDADLFYIQNIWQDLAPEDRQHLREQAAKYKTKRDK